MNDYEKRKNKRLKNMYKKAIFMNISTSSTKRINNLYKFHRRKIERADYLKFLLTGIFLVAYSTSNIIQNDQFELGMKIPIFVQYIILSLGIWFLYEALHYEKFDLKRSLEVYDEDSSKFTTQFFFHKDRVFIYNKIGLTEKSYKDIYAIYEDVDHYYIFPYENKAQIIRKDSFTLGNNKEFVKFIKEKLGKKYQKKCIRRRKEIA